MDIIIANHDKNINCEPEQENIVPNVAPVVPTTQKRQPTTTVQGGFSARVMQPTESSRQRTAASVVNRTSTTTQNRTAGNTTSSLYRTGSSSTTSSLNRPGTTSTTNRISGVNRPGGGGTTTSLYRPGGGVTTTSLYRPGGGSTTVTTSRVSTRTPAPSSKVVKPNIRDGPGKRPASSSFTLSSLDSKDMEGISGKFKLLQTQITSLSQNVMTLAPEVVAPHQGVVTELTVCSNEIQQAEELFHRQVKEQKELENRHNIESNTLENRLLLLQTQLESTQMSLGLTRSEKIQNQTKLTQLEEEIFRTTAELFSTTERFNLEKKTVTERMETEFSLKEQHFSEELRNLTSKSDETELLNLERQKTIESLETVLNSQKSRILHLEQKSRQDESLRKHLHESIQELKGNIRVMCRVRPPLGTESTDGITHIFPSPSELCIEVCGGRDVTGCPTPKVVHPFKFDRVFGPLVSQESVFEEISHLVQSSLDGYNCCIFAYGQTGSGKTYTMEGGSDRDNPESRGMISRAVQQVFKSSDRLKSQGWIYDMQASFLEIYNDTIIDLLVKNPNNSKTLDLKLDQNGKTTVPDLTKVKVKTPASVFKLLSRATSNRATAETSMNPNSSRSHSIFQLFIVGNNSVTGETVEGLLNLIDLAGSEKLEQSKATGATKKETIHINQSLCNLSKVISAIAKNDKHIPYRNSKLTFLLQNSLGGSAKTIMFVNISPAMENLKETLSSLRFATAVNSCEIGTAKKNVK